MIHSYGDNFISSNIILVKISLVIVDVFMITSVVIIIRIIIIIGIVNIVISTTMPLPIFLEFESLQSFSELAIVVNYCYFIVTIARHQIKNNHIIALTFFCSTCLNIKCASACIACEAR